MPNTLLPIGTVVNRKDTEPSSALLPLGSMQRVNFPKEPTDFGKRILDACAEEGRSPTSAERDARIPKGYLSRMIYGTRGVRALNTEYAQALARVLHVNFEWLVTGEGPMRRGGRGTTPAEQAIAFARAQGAREDAIRAAWTRHKDREAEMTAWDWVDAIGREVELLNRAGVPRPEVTHEHKVRIAREKKKLENAKNKEEERVTEPTPARKRAAAGGV